LSFRLGSGLVLLKHFRTMLPSAKNILRLVPSLLFCLALTSLALAQADRDFIQKFNIAVQYFNFGNYSEAAKILSELYRRQPQNERVFNLLKESYQKLQAYQPQEELLLDWLSHSPDDYLSIAELGEVQLALGRVQEAQKSFQKALSLAEDKVIVYVKIASAYLTQKQPQEAVAVYLKARRNSGSPYLFSRELAQVYEAMGQTEKALQEYFNYYNEDTNRAPEIEMLVKTLLEKKEKLALVERFLKRKIEQSPQEVLAYQLLGEVYLEKEDYHQALGVYQILDRLLKAEGELVLSFVESCISQSQLEIARRGVNFVLQKYPQSDSRTHAQFILAEIYRKQDNYSSALEVLQQILSASPAEKDKVKALFLAGQISFEQKDFASALYYYKTLAERQTFPQLVQQALLGMGDSYLAGGKKDSALICYRKLTKPNLSPEIRENILFKLGEFFFLTQEFDSASTYYNQIAREAPRSPLANDALERLRILIGHKTLDSAGLALFSQSQWLAFQGKHQLALEKLQELKNSSGSLKELAYLEEAKLLQKQKDWKNSLGVLQELSQKHPESYYTPWALKLCADLYQDHLQQPALALELYQRILREYPQALFLEEVRQRVKQLTTGPKGS